jgi:hypothetical protein
VKLKSRLALNWFSVKRETPDCTTEVGILAAAPVEAAKPDEGIAN